MIIDGDHNYYTVREELRLIDAGAGRGPLPLLAFHDVCWPLARRDTYREPERIPPEYRQPLVRRALIAPGEPGIAAAGSALPVGGRARGRPTQRSADRDRGLHAGSGRSEAGIGARVLRARRALAEDAPWAAAVAKIVGPWDRNPMLERVEADRVAHIAARALLRSLLESRAFALAERLSRLWHRGAPVISREQVRRILGDE